ncbi:hypothetical protein MLD38_025974 [Melastoma candidum]|uniref:Uncharacterized protein n=1 Tax=Melastoma candidum TaxID=119954 RepID=A0ACB9P3W1_9MYRT|nr:hypothetical protein MLD38_025974 [Melastoma candidum]
MEEAVKSSSLHHQQQPQPQQQQMLMQQQRQQQQFLLLQQLQKQQQQAAAISRFPSNIDAHLRPPGMAHRPIQPNPVPNAPQQQQHTQQPQQQQQQQQQQQKVIRPGNQAEFQMAYQDAWRVCHPDFKRPFSSLEDSCERLLPYHVIADYEAEEDDRILDSDTMGQVLSRSQQWDHNIAAKVAEFTSTFEKQALAFNMITRKRAQGEFRSEERLMIEQTLLLDEKKAMLELRSEIESRERAWRDAHEAQLRMAAMAQAGQARAESQAHAEMMARGPIRMGARGSQVNDMSMNHDLEDQEKGANPDEMMNGWPNNAQKDDGEPSEDFLNDEFTENGGEVGVQSEWREVGEFDLNARGI